MPRSSAALVKEEQEDEEEADDENNNEEESHHISSTFTIQKIDEILHILATYYIHFSSTETRATFQPVRSQYRTDRSRPFRVLA